MPPPPWQMLPLANQDTSSENLRAPAHLDQWEPELRERYLLWTTPAVPRTRIKPVSVWLEMLHSPSTAGAEKHPQDFTERHTRDSPAQVRPSAELQVAFKVLSPSLIMIIIINAEGLQVWLTGDGSDLTHRAKTQFVLLWRWFNILKVWSQTGRSSVRRYLVWDQHEKKRWVQVWGCEPKTSEEKLKEFDTNWRLKHFLNCSNIFLISVLE